MAKPNQAEDQTMQEILASIRRMMASDRPAAAQPPQPQAVATGDNVSPLFAIGRPAGEPPIVAADDDDLAPGDPASATIVELAIAQAMSDIDLDHRGDGAMRPLRPAASPPEDQAAVATPAAPVVVPQAAPPAARAAAQAAAPAPEPREAPVPVPGLLSPETGAAIAGAFDQLPRGLLAGGHRTVDGLVEDLLRPMLRDWLDDNLPPLVERLVREEIERVSRGRR
jgi:cell pole-organizing protein PopZ